MSDALPLVVGSFGGIAALVAVFLTWLNSKAKREAEEGASRVDALGLGVSSMKDALELNRLDIAALRLRIEAAEKREAQCWARVQELTNRIEELTGS